MKRVLKASPWTRGSSAGLSGGGVNDGVESWE